MSIFSSAWSIGGALINGAVDVVQAVGAPVLGAASAVGVPGASLAQTGLSFVPQGGGARTTTPPGYDETGWDWNPLDAYQPNLPTARAGGRTIFDAPAATAQPIEQLCYRCPKGYVLVTDRATGAKSCVLKCVAREMGLWRARPKPPISAADYRKMRIAARVEKKVKRLAGMAGFTCRTKGSGRKR